MASPSKCSSLLLSAWLIVFFFLRSDPVHAVNKGVLAATCIHTKNPTFCIDTLQADPRTETADLFGLVIVSVNLALVNSSKTLDYINSQLSSATDQKQHFEFCKDKYKTSFDTVKNAASSFDYGNYQAVYDYCDIASLGPKQCEDNFSSAPSIPSPLTTNNENYEYLIDMISSITRQLP